MPSRRLNLDEAAEYLHLPVRDLEELVRRREIPCERQGGRLQFLRGEVDAWASQRILGMPEARLEKYHRNATVRVRHRLGRAHAIVAELLRPAAVVPALASRTKASLLRDMVEVAGRTELLYDPADLLASLREREELCPTAIENGVALLHPRHHDPYLAGDSFIALGRVVHPLPFGAADGRQTDLFFLICCQDDRIHLHVLARLCLMCLHTGMLEQLRAAADGAEMAAAVAAAERQAMAGIPADGET
ncbi:MAG: PTS sugar transporter subunit IIA [Lentisphaeria bacterium]